MKFNRFFIQEVQGEEHMMRDAYRRHGPWILHGLLSGLVISRAVAPGWSSHAILDALLGAAFGSVIAILIVVFRLAIGFPAPILIPTLGAHSRLTMQHARGLAWGGLFGACFLMSIRAHWAFLIIGVVCGVGGYAFGMYLGGRHSLCGPKGCPT